jgi:RND superfamily putative drug exporter
MLERVGGWCYRRRWRVLGLWVLALIVIGAASGAVGSDYSNNFGNRQTESQQAFDVLQQRFPARSGDTAQIVFRAPAGISNATVARQIDALAGRLAEVPHVEDVVTPAENPRQLSTGDRRIGYAEVQLDQRAWDVPKATVNRIEDLVAGARTPDLQIETGGQVFGQMAPPGNQEAVGLLAAIVILLISFGSLLAAGLPILVALFGIGIGASLLGLITHVLDTAIFAPQIAAMIGIGVGIDYALFIVTRYRSGLDAGLEPDRAVSVAVATAGRAVLFAGTTVVISIMGMLLMGISFIRGVAVGASLAVLVTMVASVTLLPAMLGFVGRTIDRFSLPGTRRRRGDGHRGSVAYRYSRAIQRRPWPAAIGGLLVLLVLAAPVLSIRLGASDDGNLPESTSPRRAYDLLSTGFGPGFNGPMILAARLPAGDVKPVDDLSAALAKAPGVAQASPAVPSPKGDAAVIYVIPKTAPQDAATSELVHHLRKDVVPRFERNGTQIYLGGLTAAFADQADYMGARLPVFFAAVITLSFLLLMVVFRSVLVPLKAAIMNLLSIGASFGVLVAIFQWGWLGSLIGIGRAGPIEAWAPMMLFAVVFGLSMDYEVFLLSRVHEEWVNTGDNATAVADGLAATARVITAAALIMVCVFGSFVLTDLRVLKEMGTGLAVAVFIDATLVRMVLVPATMELLGDRNWWLPRWLDRIIPHVSVEGATQVEEDDERELATA